MLFPGVVCFLIAAITGLLVHASNTDDIQKKLGKILGPLAEQVRCIAK